MAEIFTDESHAPTFMTLNALAEAAGSHPRKIKRPPDGVLISGKRRTVIYKIDPATVRDFKDLQQIIYGNH